MAEVQDLLISQIEVGPHRQRTEIDDERIQELAASIRRVGILVPILVVRKDGAFLLVAGHRRIAAAQAAGLAAVPAIIREDSEAEAVEVRLAENFFRLDLSPVEQAAAIRECLDNGIMKIEELANVLHRSQQWIKAQTRITNWPPEILKAIHLRQISVSAASHLAEVDDSQYRGFLLYNAVENGSSAKATAAWVNSWRLSRPPEEAIAQVPVDGVVPAAIVVPQGPCLFCTHVFRNDALNYMGVCGNCLAQFQQAREKVDQQPNGG